MNGQFDQDGVWLNIERLAQNAVVQVFAQVGKFNWLEPYKIGEQFENRGTGFFVNEFGYIVTNYHVIQEAKTIWIQIPYLGRRIIKAFLVGFCPESDIALLKIAKEGYTQIRDALGKIPFLVLGNSDNVKRTETVMVLGYPLGHHLIKSTIGVISGRESTGGVSLLQTTAPVNPGSSGGPLISSFGSVIGIAVSTHMMVHNVGYAIPINELKVIFDDLQKEMLLRKPILGALFQNATDAQAKFLGNPQPAGFYIVKVLKKSLMAKEGILPGDMLYTFNGFAIDAYGEAQVPWSSDRVLLRDLISRLSIGELVSIVLYRNGKKKEVNFSLETPPVYPIRTVYPGHEDVEYEIVGGMIIMQLTVNHIQELGGLNPNLFNYLKVENMVDPGLVITHILPGSYAQQLRCLMIGDIIKSVNGDVVKTLDDFRVAIKKSIATDFLSLETTENILAVFSFRSMLKDEENMASSFSYPISVSMSKIIRMVKDA